MTKMMGITRLPLAVVDEEGNSSCPWCGEAVSRKSSAHYFKKHNVRPAAEGEFGDWVVVE
jgi:hypothetical protein